MQALSGWRKPAAVIRTVRLCAPTPRDYLACLLCNMRMSHPKTTPHAKYRLKALWL